MKTCVPSAKVDPSDISSLRIAGFGAWMITGYPHKSAGLFEIACGVVEKLLSRPVQSTIVSLGGFPAPRAEKYLKKRCLASIRNILSSNSALPTRSVRFELGIARPIAVPNFLAMANLNPVRL
jgi:hypothetical protein